MIEDPNGMELRIADPIGGHLSVHKTSGLCGLVVSDREGGAGGIVLTDDDRRALAAALLEGL